MSGNSVQRGTVACVEKYLRARTAVENGVNLVVELPFPYCSLSAADFASAGVFISNALCCGNLAFGAESSKEAVIKAADILYDKQKISEYIKLHPKLSYPKAVSEIIKAEFGEEASLIEKPNNILAAEYINAIRAGGFPIKPIFVERNKNYASSSEIRETLYKDSGAGFDMLPEETVKLLKDADIWDGTKLDPVLLAAVRLSGGKGGYYGIDSGSFNKIYSASLVSSCVRELCEKSVSSNLTYARIRRTLLCVLFSVGKEYQKQNPSYALVLAADIKGRAYLAENKNCFRIPVITKPADYVKAGEKATRDFEFSLKADSVLSIASGKSGEYNPLRITPYMK
jgi:predicted nucleotidyltransferase